MQGETKMFYNSNWEKTKERFDAFWHQEMIDRCCIAISVPEESHRLYNSSSIKYNESDRFDAEYLLKQSLEDFENTYFAGDAFALLRYDLGPSGHAGFFKNAKLRFHADANGKIHTWYEPSILDWKTDQIEFDENSFLYNVFIEGTEYLAVEAKGRFVIAMPDSSGNIDALAYLRGNENLMMDLIEAENDVIRALETIQKVWLDTTEWFHQKVTANNDGGNCISWLSTYAKGRHQQIQCDESVMFSSEMFDKFAVPEIKAKIDWADHSLYHFDGIEQIRHLDSLLGMKDLSAIQWTPVTGQPGAENYLPELKKIQAAGKSLVLHVNVDNIAFFLDHLSSKGLFLISYTDSKEAADYMVKTAEKRSKE